MHRRFTATVAAIAVVLVGCGQDGDPASSATTSTTAAPTGSSESSDVDASVLVEAVWTTTEARSARTDFSAEVDANGDQVLFGGTGITMFGDDRGSLTLDISELLAANGLVDLDGDLDTVFEGTTSYIKGEFFTTLLSPPTEWLRFDAEELPTSTDENALGDGFGGLTQFAGYDPALGLTLLSAIVDGTVEEVGREEVQGVSTTKYRAKVNIRNALAATAPSVRDRLLPRLGEDDLEVEAWVDEGSFLRRFAYRERGPDGDEDPVVLEYYDFGVEEPVVVPTDEASNLFDYLMI